MYGQFVTGKLSTLYLLSRRFWLQKCTFFRMTKVRWFVTPVLTVPFIQWNLEYRVDQANCSKLCVATGQRCTAGDTASDLCLFQVDKDKLRRCIFVVLKNQFLIVCSMALAYPLMRHRGMPWASELPSFQRVLLELAGCVIVEEFGFYYAHRWTRAAIVFVLHDDVIELLQID